ncbi:MAG TPA: MarR family transcriptional regulator [Propioniciclava sp.]|jgi:DNA-binding MarR family transcriptional regulator|uniref:MarR family winged helix-turn-helix transcriptional regulator n=1 Tax=Propioniciclava sp. TaxID=2038686 RepID=UPI002C32CBAE|nr:MarR family transcriptional regulator [Propioniciclava sp.]HRL50046.1 MarR family transcriptional regulator [Propioniciclava sp.]HRL80382.1 MarR family transcriptional regulator [Propioniciclava sp.]
MPEPAPTRWLSSEQQEIWRAYLDAVAHIDRHLDERLRPFGLDLGEYEILVRLSESDDRQMRMSDLASAARQSRSRLTHTVSRMEKKGLIERAPCPEDRRGVIATLTPEGMDLLIAAAPEHVSSVRDVFVDIVAPEDFSALGRAMAAVNAVAH